MGDGVGERRRAASGIRIRLVPAGEITDDNFLNLMAIFQAVGGFSDRLAEPLCGV
jgi:hypothetical protein